MGHDHHIFTVVQAGGQIWLILIHIQAAPADIKASTVRQNFGTVWLYCQPQCI